MNRIYLVHFEMFKRIWLVLAMLCSVDSLGLGCRQLVVIDADPGIDDAMAILTTLGDPHVALLAVTLVRGNADLSSEIANLYKTLYVACRLDVPVYIGTNFGLLVSPTTDNYFGQDGFGDLGNNLTYNPEWATHVQHEHAAVFLARIVRQHIGRITILAQGPLTNIALAIELNPDFLKQVKRVVVLGGSIRGSGNVAPGVEFNFYMDPEAAAVVLSRAEICNTSITLMPMETVVDCDLGQTWRQTQLTKIHNPAMTFLNILNNQQREMHPLETQHYYPYDAYAALAFLNPKTIISLLNVYGFVETGGQTARGVLLIDYLNLKKKNSNLNVVTKMDKEEVRKKIIHNLSSYAKCTPNYAINKMPGSHTSYYYDQ